MIIQNAVRIDGKATGLVSVYGGEGRMANEVTGVKKFKTIREQRHMPVRRTTPSDVPAVRSVVPGELSRMIYESGFPDDMSQLIDLDAVIYRATREFRMVPYILERHDIHHR